MATVTQRTRFRNDIGDSLTSPAFSDAEIDDLYTRATEQNITDTESVETFTRWKGYEQLLANAAKRASYMQNQSSERLSDIFKHLKDMLNYWKKRYDDAVAADNGGVIAWGAPRKKPTRLVEYPDS